MRVVHLVCSTGFAGVERYMVNVAIGLVRADVSVVVIGGDDSQMRSAFAGTDVEWLPGHDMRSALASLRTSPVPDILHTHMSQADLVGWWYRRGTGRRSRHVSTRHFAGRRGGSAVARALFRPIGQSLAAQIAISHFVAQNVEPPAEVVYSGVESTDAVTPRGRFVLAAQRLEPEKKTADVIEAWARSSGPRDGWRLRIAGDGSERDALEGLARSRQVAESVDFLGHRTDVPDLLASAALVVAPTPREGLGILVLEAMAHGTPVVAAGGGGHLETVGIAAPGLLFAPGDTAAAARIIDELLADPLLRKSSGDALRGLQQERFTIEAQVAGTRAVYERLFT